MTEKQAQFCAEYLKDNNATRAYMAAYPNIKSPSSAAACASKLLKNAEIREFIDEKSEELLSEKIADAQEILEFLTATVRGETTEETVTSEGKVKRQVSARERIRAAELLGKRLGIFADKLNIDENAKVTVIDDC